MNMNSYKLGACLALVKHMTRYNREIQETSYKYARARCYSIARQFGISKQDIHEDESIVLDNASNIPDIVTGKGPKSKDEYLMNLARDFWPEVVPPILMIQEVQES